MDAPAAPTLRYQLECNVVPPCTGSRIMSTETLVSDYRFCCVSQQMELSLKYIIAKRDRRRAGPILYVSPYRVARLQMQLAFTVTDTHIFPCQLDFFPKNLSAMVNP